MIVIELNDTGVTASRDGELSAVSPAFVHLGRRDVKVGADAAAGFKLDPGQTESEFWHRFGRDELRRRHRQARYQADLAYLHLEQLWGQVGERNTPVVFVVPGDFRKDQAALLLGMAKRLGMAVHAMVDAGIAGSATPRPGRHLLYLDLHLYRAVLTDLAQGEALSAMRSAASPEAGWLRVLDAWADAVSRIFVQSTRFDPMHDAATEQRLHDQLAGWAEALQDADQVAVSLEDRGRRFDAELNRSAIIAAAGPLYRRLADFVAESLPGDAPASLQLTHRAGQLPGLADTLREIPELEVMVLGKRAVPAGVEEMAITRPAGDAVPFLREKPWWARSTQGEHARALGSFSRRRPTHWVVGGIARPIGSAAPVSAAGAPAGAEADVILTLATEDDAVRLDGNAPGLLLNGRAVDDDAPRLAAGDRIRSDRGGLDILLVAVDDGP